MLSCLIKDRNHRICVNGNITLCLPSMAVCGLARCASFRKFNSRICYAACVGAWMLCD